MELISDEMIEVINFVLSGGVSNVVCGFGIATNIINLVVFYRNGFSDANNISLFTLAISDLGSLVFLLWTNICAHPLMVRFVNLPYVASDIQFVIGGLPRICFSKVTCMITIFITIQRCLCIVLPFKVKSLITPGRTWWVMIFLHITAFLLVIFPLVGTGAVKLAWKFEAARNRSRYGMIISANFAAVTNASDSVLTAFQLISFAAIVITTCALVVQLRKQTKWRKTSGTSGVDNAIAVSKRDERLALMVIFLSVIFIVSYVPVTISYLLSLFFPELDYGSAQENTFLLMFQISFLGEAISSSVNIFLYYKMSSKYRETLDRWLYGGRGRS